MPTALLMYDLIFSGPNCEEAACVDLDGEWSEQSKVFRHPEFDEPDILLVSGEVGEGGDHVNINLKNVGDREVMFELYCYLKYRKSYQTWGFEP